MLLKCTIIYSQWKEIRLVNSIRKIVCFYYLLQFERSCCMVLTIFMVIKMIVMSIVHTAVGYTKSVILGLQLKGPPAKIFLGNVSIFLDRNSKLTI